MNVPQPECLQKPLNVPSKLLMGPGPSNSPLRVHYAMMKPLLGHLHPEFTQVTIILCLVFIAGTNIYGFLLLNVNVKLIICLYFLLVSPDIMQIICMYFQLANVNIDLMKSLYFLLVRINVHPI